MVLRWKIEFFLLMLIVGFFLFAGCALTGESVDAYHACMNNTDCVAQMVAAKNVSAGVVSTVVDAHMSGIGTLIGQFVGYVVSGITGVLLGWRIKKK